jgi:hypothetical protein
MLSVIKIFSFFTIISLIFHILSYFNFIGSTLPLAILILIGSIILYWIFPGYYFMYWDKGLLFISLLLITDILLHYVPVYILYKNNNNNYAYKEIFILILLYLIIMNSKIFVIYKDPLKWLKS